MKIHLTMLGRLLAHDLALLAQPSGHGAQADPCQRRCDARPRRGHRAKHALGGALTVSLAVTDRRQGPASGHGEGPGKASGMVRRRDAHRGDGTAVRRRSGTTRQRFLDCGVLRWSAVALRCSYRTRVGWGVRRGQWQRAMMARVRSSP
jgi:hypothetical protein